MISFSSFKSVEILSSQDNQITGGRVSERTNHGTYEVIVKDRGGLVRKIIVRKL